MKFFIMLIMLSTMLFSWQKQIILGSYSVKSNGERALKTLNNQIENDKQLQGFMKEHSLRTINTQISGYTVVSLNVFNSYTELLNTMNVLKVYYSDAFVIKYPTKNIRLGESLEDIAKKAKMEEEAALAEQAQEAEDEAKRVELKKLLEIDAMNEEETNQIEAEALKEDSAEAVAVAEETVQETLEEIPAVEEEAVEEISQEETSNPMEEYMLYIIALVLLALIAAGFTVVKIANAKSSKSQENE